ncbi:uncharacterized protein METZ01_LOCUS509004 [marine metagenome]|uniref:Uncharacterized protein n=1 Tax=marine metagenome TaxID=408172 RepID=A0A383EIH4_9ZZZZ
MKVANELQCSSPLKGASRQLSEKNY